MTDEYIIHKITGSSAQTEAVGAEFAAYLQTHAPGGAFCALYGDLGAGKTAFVRGAAAILAPGAHVQSPTYTIVHEYRSASALPLLHFDFYRVDDEDSLDSIGYWDYLAGDGFLFAEWSEKIPYALPDVYYQITIEKSTDDLDSRDIRIIRREGGMN